ncbi:MAG: hypothetical protein NVS1B13_02690 [Flavisolibacter sp.]
MVMKDRLSLDQILEHIKLHSDHLKRYDAEVQSLDEAAKGARGWMPPELGTGLWMVPYNPSLWRKGANGTNGMGQYMISGQQMFPNLKRQKAEEVYLGAKSLITKEEKLSKENDLFAEAKKNFYGWIVAKKKLGIINENLKLLDFMIKSAEIRYRNGADKISAYYKAKAAMGSAANTKLLLENEIIQKRITLNTLMHRDRKIIFEIDTSFDINKYDAPILDSASLVHSRSDLKAIEKVMEVTRLEQDLEKRKLNPEFGIRYDHMFGFGGSPMQYSLMGILKIPLARWSSRAGKANIQSLNWKLISQQSEQLAMINEALGMANSVKAEIETKHKQIKLYEQVILPALKKSFTTTQLAYEQNTEDFFLLYDAWEKLNMTQMEYLDIQEQLITMGVEFERILQINER